MTPKFKTMQKALIAAVVTVGVLMTPAVASAAPCSLGAPHYTTNRVGMTAIYSHLKVYGGNCASAQYVLNKWIRRQWRNSYSNYVRRSFYDGWVTWHGYRGAGSKWIFREYDSGTAFTFHAQLMDY